MDQIKMRKVRLELLFMAAGREKKVRGIR